jgi:hypothetical protein
VGLLTIFYCLRFETSLFIASYNSEGYTGGCSELGLELLQARTEVLSLERSIEMAKEEILSYKKNIQVLQAELSDKVRLKNLSWNKIIIMIKLKLH